MINYFRTNEELQIENQTLKKQIEILKTFEERFTLTLNTISEKNKEKIDLVHNQLIESQQQLDLYEQRFLEMKEQIIKLVEQISDQQIIIEDQQQVIKEKDEEIKKRNEIIRNTFKLKPKPQIFLTNHKTIKKENIKTKKALKKEKLQNEYLQGLLLANSSDKLVEYFKQKYLTLQEKYLTKHSNQ